MTARVAILISGGGSNMMSLAAAMVDDFPARCALVLSNRPDAGGLGKAASLGLPTAIVDHRAFDTRAAFETDLHAKLISAGADFICLAGFMRILGADFVAKWQGRMLNIHPSLLPKYPGLNTHARALAAGDTEAGCTVHWVTAGLDEGPIVGQARVPIIPGDDAGTLAARVLVQEHALYPQALAAALTGTKAPVLL